MSFPRYPAYKPSGVEWLGEVPEHWSVKPLKHCIHRLGSGGTPESGNRDYWADNESDDSIPWVAIGDMSSAYVVYSTAKSLTQAGVKEKNLEIFPAGSLLYSIYASLGKVSILGVDAAFNQAILAIISNPELVSQSFLRYWLENIEKHLCYYSSSNTQANLNAAKVLAYPVAVPLPDEQLAIATFLDRETAKIDALIAEQQRLIELLQEKRQAVISHAVTKGLNPDAPMKDSGVEWLGDVPEHWDVVQIKWLSPVKRGASPRPIEDPVYFDEAGEYAWVRISDVTSSGGRLQSTTQRLSRLGSDLSVKLEPGSLFVSIAGSVGKPCITSIKACIHDGFVYFPCLEITPELLELVFRSAACFGGLGKLGTQLNLNTDTIGAIRIGLPKEDCEIDAIVKHCKDEIARLDELEEQAISAVSLLQERRSALISAAVTGQIDLRGLVSEAEAA
jgi:type I restriction enzyme, S subunit